jgi:hypothetical protein
VIDMLTLAIRSKERRLVQFRSFVKSCRSYTAYNGFNDSEIINNGQEDEEGGDSRVRSFAPDVKSRALPRK